jgi:large subunit ribosomal protein L29
MKTKDLRQKSEKEIGQMLRALREKARQLRFDLSAGKVKNIKELSEVKKDIARILTILNEKK